MVPILPIVIMHSFVLRLFFRVSHIALFRMFARQHSIGLHSGIIPSAHTNECIVSQKVCKDFMNSIRVHINNIRVLKPIVR